MSSKSGWKFSIDAGGTFTDLVAQRPDGSIVTHKILSSGAVKGQIQQLADSCLTDKSRIGDPDNVWRGYTFTIKHPTDQPYCSTVVSSSGMTGELQFSVEIPDSLLGSNYELTSDEQAPVIGIRYLLGLDRHAPIPPLDLRLGTTRGTNALLERRGARCGYITTAGFRDALIIGHQDRPRLFDLNIQKPLPLHESVIEIDERISAEGEIIQAIDLNTCSELLLELRDQKIDSIAICLLHAWRNPAHEQQLGSLARELGFTEISLSHEVSPAIGLIARGDTTLVNAYLNPVLRTYLDSIRASLPGSTIKLMSSSGGLVSADHFGGKDSILSGPAGGVVGLAEIARLRGIPKIIGFDMGGTSTDVCRYDGQFHREFETTKAGVRLATPMLAIETVAAGGGSICHFDGVRLQVGPQSAGANPGPCCYGNDGPLTITDMNVITGRVLPQHFPFSLDVAAVRTKLETLCQQIANSTLAQNFTPEKLAEGFLEIANIRMARAIRKVSAARGYDPADHVLVSFGGAGGQHACSIAKELGIQKIVIHPLAGLFSAYGIGCGDQRQIESQSILKLLQEITKSELTNQLLILERTAQKALRDQGVEPNQFDTAEFSLDMRYAGTETPLTISQPEDEDFSQAFRQEFHTRFGYSRPEQPIEVVTARAEVIAKTPRFNSTNTETNHPEMNKTQAIDSQTHNIFINGSWQSAQVYDLHQIPPGLEIIGPAILLEKHSTILIAPAFRAVIDEERLLTITPVEATHSTRNTISPTEKTSPILLELFHNHFASIAEQMGETLRQTAQSVNVKERLDYSCAVFDRTGALIANAPHVPVHLGAMGETVKHLLAEFSAMQPGDAYITNDPYQGGSHLPDVTVVTPMFSGIEKKLQFLVASRAHHAEIGGITPGSMPPFSKTLAEEGVVIRPFRLLSAEADFFEELRSLLSSGKYPSRKVEENLADVRAQLAANQVGVRLLEQLTHEHSTELVNHYVTQIRRTAAEKTRLSLDRLPQEQMTFTDHLDDGSPIKVSITRTSERVTVDFTGTGPVLKSNLNANRAIVTAAVLYVFRCLIDEDIPLNSGVLDMIDIILPECLLNPPGNPDPALCPAVVGGNVETSQRVVDVLLGALQLAAASQGTMNNLTFGDKTFGYYETICGGSGATSQANGCDAVHTHMTNTRLTDVEILEHRYPIRVIQHAIRKNSGGKGKQRGGNGLIRELEFLQPLSATLLAQRRKSYLPFGIQGGGTGQAGQTTWYQSHDDSSEELEGCFAIQVKPGDRLKIETPGGGGWGKSPGEPSQS
ncbi:hydantoinase B/oxoprolinase family protein [Rubinisphaera italica]|uniref:Acetophenone carboxylase gamma subunit n=1 Tax=Rubinisphaera italica TaxID=2527969 RepID=A0A5C5XFN5_9PLAN|nr:hydantoinase B/oxoprolinase family protein [Rubinisphaera italica]TWT61926.1 Acetophenone carboxylase gamma subunit [Rubinisphaera italica]